MIKLPWPFTRCLNNLKLYLHYKRKRQCTYAVKIVELIEYLVIE